MTASTTRDRKLLPAEVDVLIVGAGFGGIAALHRILTDHSADDVLVIERADGPGGVWRANTYPGAACDVPTSLYSLSFADNPNWSHTYGRGGEIRTYLESVAQGFSDHIHYGCEMLEATWDDARSGWLIQTSDGQIRARILIAASGALSAPTIPAVNGLESFRGKVFHTAAWDHETDLKGQRVAVIGSGASAVQVVPEIVEEVAQLVVFSRTPAWVIPRMDRPISAREQRLYARRPWIHRLVRRTTWATHEFHVLAMAHQRKLLTIFTAIARAHLRRQIADPQLRARLTPGFTIGCKRILISNKWYPALQNSRTTVTGALTSLTPTAVCSDDGREFEVDTVIFATGFTPTSPPLAALITGRDGRRLDEFWAGSPQAYRGVEVLGFPNLFLLYGPNTNLGHSSIILMLESQCYYIGKLIAEMRSRNSEVVEVTMQASAAYNQEIDAQLAGTVWNSGGCGSWYLDETGRNSVMWPTYTSRYRALMSRVIPADHIFSPAGADAQNKLSGRT